MLTKFTALAMGVLLSVSVSAADMATADMATLTRQAQSGDAAAQVDLANEYYQQGNHAKAFEWYTKAVGQGHATAQYNLGRMYDNGHGVRQDDQKAFEWYTKAANQGHADAQYTLGVMYDYGRRGVLQDYQKAFEWFTKAANQGHAKAQYNLGWMYENGRGVSQDKSTAKIYYHQACVSSMLGCENSLWLNEQGY